MTTPDKSEIITLLQAEWDAIASLCDPLTDEQWHSPTECTGWTVKDQVSHIIGTEKMLLGDPLPDIEVGDAPHVKNAIGKANEKWITERRPRPPAEVLAEFREVTAQRIAALNRMTAEEFTAPSWTPAGEDTYARFMQIRLFDCWTHEQDIRQAIAQPGHEAGAVVDEVLGEVRRSMSYVVAKLGEAPVGSRVEFQLAAAAGSDGSGTTIRVELPDDGSLAAEVAEFAGGAAPTAVIAMSLPLFLRLVCGRESAAAAINDRRVTLSGDPAVAERIAKRLSYVI